MERRREISTEQGLRSDYATDGYQFCQLCLLLYYGMCLHHLATKFLELLNVLNQNMYRKCENIGEDTLFGYTLSSRANPKSSRSGQRV